MKCRICGIEKWRFTWQVADDDKDGNSAECAFIRHKGKGRIIASFDSSRAERWPDHTDHSFEVKGIQSLELDQLGHYQLGLTHDPVGHDTFKFYFKVEGFSSEGQKVYENRWGKITLSSSKGTDQYDLDIEVPEMKSLDESAIRFEDQTSETSRHNFTLLCQKYGDPYYVVFKPAQFGVTEGFRVTMKWEVSSQTCSWTFLGLRWRYVEFVDRYPIPTLESSNLTAVQSRGPNPSGLPAERGGPSPEAKLSSTSLKTPLDPGSTVTQHIIRDLQLPVEIWDLPFERDHRNLIVNEEARIFERDSKGTWVQSRGAGDFKEDPDDEERDDFMKKCRQRYNQYVLARPYLESGSYIVITENEEPQVYKSYAHAYLHIKGRKRVFGCTYYGLKGDPLRINFTAVGGFYGNPDPVLPFESGTEYQYNYGYIKMRLLFQPVKYEEPRKPVLPGFMRKDVQMYETKLAKYKASSEENLKRRQYTTVIDDQNESIEVPMMIHTGATISLGPESVLSNLGLDTTPSSYLVRGYNHSRSPTRISNLSLELQGQDPSSPRITIPIEIYHIIRGDKNMYTGSGIKADIKSSDQWILGHNYLKYFQQLWTANSYVDLTMIPEYLNNDGSFNILGDYEHSRYRDREERTQLYASTRSRRFVSTQAYPNTGDIKTPFS